MVRSLKYCPSVLLAIFFLGFCCSCGPKDILYKKEYSEEDKLLLSETLLNGAGTDLYYQGSVGERMIIREGMKYNPQSAWGEREIGVPYLKRGFATEAYEHYKKAVEADAEEWLGYKAYCWLYFYRDYEMVLKDVERFDAFTPDFVDYPQSTSVNYMRGVCHLQLGNYEEAIKYMQMHVDREVKDVGYNYVASLNYVLLGMGYQKQGLHEKADSIYDIGLVHNKNASELHFYKAQNLFLSGRNKEAADSWKKAQDWFSKGGNNIRPYVEEFYAIYQEDLTALEGELGI